MKKTTIGAMLLLMLTITAMSVAAFPGFKGEASRAALESRDYDAWVESLPEDERAFVTSVISEDDFERVADRYAERQAEREERQAARQAVKDALLEQDFDAWEDAIAQLERKPEWFSLITEDTFDLLVDAHEARAEGNREEARSLMQELEEALGVDIEPPRRGRRGGFGR